MQQIIPNSQREMELKGMSCLMVDMPQICHRAVLCKFVNRYFCKKWQISHQQLHKYENYKIK